MAAVDLFLSLRHYIIIDFLFHAGENYVGASFVSLEGGRSRPTLDARAFDARKLSGDNQKVRIIHRMVIGLLHR